MKKVISLNTIVTVKSNDILKTFLLVRSENVDSSFSKISDISPLGKLLLGSKVKDVIKVITSDGVKEYEVVSVKT